MDTLEQPAHSSEQKQRVKTLESLHLLDSPPDERFDRHTRLLRHITGADYAGFTLQDHQRSSCKSSQGFSADEVVYFESLCRLVVENDAPLIIADTANHPDLDKAFNHQQVATFAGLPIHDSKGNCLGCLFIANHRPNAFNTNETESLYQMASLVENDVHWIQQSTCDPLTGLCNKQGFHNAAKHVLALCERLNSHATLVFYELDNVQTLNAMLGREGGDLALKAFAEILSQTMRNSDVVARYDGSLFVALLPHNENFSISSIAKRLVNCVQSFNSTTAISADILTPRVSFLHYDKSTHTDIERMLADQQCSTPVDVINLITTR